jgi:hypothetical protein
MMQGPMRDSIVSPISLALAATSSAASPGGDTTTVRPAPAPQMWSGQRTRTAEASCRTPGDRKIVSPGLREGVGLRFILGTAMVLVGGAAGAAQCGAVDGARGCAPHLLASTAAAREP